MRLFIFLAAIAIVAGGIYHDEVSDFVAGLKGGSSGSGGGSSFVDSMQDMGDSSRSLIGGAGNALNR